MQPGESCDDGNADDTDACLSTCETATCGDGFTGPGEACDDGNTDDFDGCSATCEPEFCGDGIVQPGEACDDGNLDDLDDCANDCTLAPICIDTLGAAEGLNAFIFGDYLGGLDVQGRLAVGGDLQMTGFAIAYLDQGGDAVVTGGDLDLLNGTVYGDAIHGGTATLQGVNVTGLTYPGAPIDFAAEQAGLTALSADLASSPANGTTFVDAQSWGTELTFTGADPALDVFEVDGADVADTHTIHLDAPAGSTVVINVTGPFAAWENLGFFYTGVDRQDVLWNAPDASSIVMSAISFQGSLLAPFADVDFFNANFQGTLIAANLYGGGELHDFPFDGELLCPTCGDEVLDADETCDDGNLIDGDGCDATCTLEGVCGDGHVDAGEQCDDGNLVDGDGCTSTCEVTVALCGNGMVDPGEQCDDGNTLPGDGCDSCEIEACVPDLGAAAYANVFVDTSYIGGMHIGGPVLAGDYVAMQGFAVGWEVPGGLKLVSGGDLELDSGTVYGDVWYGGSLISNDPTTLDVRGSVTAGAPGDLDTMYASVTQHAFVLSTLPANGYASDAYGTLSLTGLQPDLHVIHLHASDLEQANGLVLDAPAGSKMVVNVTGSSARFGSMGMTLKGLTAEDVIFVFSEATFVDISAMGMQGSLLAPQADVVYDNGQMYGSIYAYSLTGTVELYRAPFTGSIDCQAWTAWHGSPSATGMLGAPRAATPRSGPGPHTTTPGGIHSAGRVCVRRGLGAVSAACAAPASGAR